MEDILRPIEKFIANIDNPLEQDTVLVTLIAIKHQVPADDKDAFRTFIAKLIEQFHGQLSAADSQSMLVGFDGTGRAIRCAQEMTAYCRSHDVPCQIGIHVGECRRSGDHLSGFPVSISQAVAETTDVGAILVTQMVRDLVTGFEFDHGNVTHLDGIDGEWVLSIVRNLADVVHS